MQVIFLPTKTMENDPGNLPASLNWVASAYFFSVVKLSEQRPRTQKFLQLKTFGHFVVHFDYSLLKYVAPVDKAPCWFGPTLGWPLLILDSYRALRR